MEKEKTTMSVPEMQRMLGLKKTDAYWLVLRSGNRRASCRV